MQTLRIAASLVVITSVVSAQATHLVGPGGFAQIDDALAVAAPGDVILVQPGYYMEFHATKGVTIRAVSPGTVFAGSLSVPNTAAVPAAQRLHLLGLTMRMLSIVQGTVTMDACMVGPTGFFTLPTSQALVVQASSVVLQDCSITGFGPSGHALAASNAVITAIDSVFTGSHAHSPSPEGGPHMPAGVGIQLQQSTLHGSHLTVVGGAAAFFGVYGAERAVTAVQSSVWLSDSSLASGAPLPTSPLAPCPLQWTSSSGRVHRCTLTPACAPGVSVGGPLLGLHRAAPMQSPGALALEYQTDANGLVGVFLSDGLDLLQAPGLEQSVWLGAANLHSMALLVADGAGLASYTCTIPMGLTNQAYWFQAVGSASPLQLSPLAGGVVR